MHHLARGVRCLLVFHQLAQLRAVRLRTQGLIEAASVRYGTLYTTHLVGGPPQPLGYLFVGGVALELCGELAVRAGHLPDLLTHLHGDPYGAPLVRHRPLHRLPYPPGRIGREAPPTVRVVLLYRLHKPYVALLDEVLEGKAHPAVLLGHRDHEPQVLLYELMSGLPITGLCPL